MEEKILSRDLQGRYASYTFRGKRENEEIILLLRRHWLILIFKIIPLLVYLATLLALGIIGPDIFLLAGIRIEGALWALIESLLWMFFWTIIFIVWIDYYLDVWIVTDQRIINIEQFGLFRRHISELDHLKIQDTTTEVEGLIPTLFNYGFVYIQTAGEKERFVFKQVPDPMKIRNIIMELQQLSQVREKRREGQLLRGKL